MGRAGLSPSHVLWLIAKWPSGSILGYGTRRLTVISPSDQLGLCRDPNYKEEARCHCIHNPEIKTKLSRSSLMDYLGLSSLTGPEPPKLREDQVPLRKGPAGCLVFSQPASRSFAKVTNHERKGNGQLIFLGLLGPCSRLTWILRVLKCHCHPLRIQGA